MPQDELRRLAGKPKREVPAAPDTSALEARIRGMAEAQLREATRSRRRQPRYAAIATAESAVVETIASEFKRAPASFDTLEAVETRRAELEQARRARPRTSCTTCAPR